MVTGRAVVVNSLTDLINDFKEGNILVVANTDKDIISYVERSGGIIAEAAGYTSHAAITAISLGIPTIFGADGALVKIATGDIVTIDPSEGTVRKGIY